MGVKLFPWTQYRNVGRDHIRMLLQNSGGDGHELTVFPEPNASALEEEQSPLVIVTYVSLVRANGLERSEVIIPLDDTVVLFPYIFEAPLQITGDRHRIAVVEPLHSQSILPSEPRLY